MGIYSRSADRPFTQRLVVIVVAAMALFALVGTPAQAANVELSGPMPAFGEVEAFVLSPDEQRVVYRADQTTDTAFELYTVAVNGGSAVRITPLLPSGERVGFFVITPDSQRVVYAADLDADGRRELHSVPIVGPPSSSVQISPAPVTGGAIAGIGVSADSSRVVYHADQDTNDIAELFSVPITGPASASVKLNPTLAPNGDVLFFRLSADGSRVVYAADQEADERFELYSVPIAGPPTSVVNLNQDLIGGGDVDAFAFDISGDSARVIYRADQAENNRHELFSVPITGPASASVVLNQTLPAAGDVEVFALTDNATRVVYIADQDVAQRRDLYSVPIAGPATTGVKLNPVPVPFGGVISFRVSADSSWVVYRANQDDVTKAELYSVPVAGPSSSTRKVSGTLLDPLGDVTSKFSISADSQWVTYIADQEVNGRDELYSVPIAGPAASNIKLNGLLASGGDVIVATISDTSTHVGYRADQLSDEVRESFLVPIGGPAGAGVRINGPLVTNGDVHLMELLAHGTGAVYLADQDVDGQDELYFGGNRAPYVAALLGDIAVSANAPNSGISLSGTFADPDGDALSLAASSSDTGLVTAGVSGTTLTLDYQPGKSGAATITVTATDPGELVAADAFIVTVSAVAPTVGLVDPAQGQWHLRNSAGQVTTFFYGNPADIPFMGDWDCDGDATPGLFRQSDAFAYLRNSNSVGIGDTRFFFGNPDDVPLAGDWNGDGCDTLSIYRPAEQRFYIMNKLGENEGGLGAADFSFLFGNPGDKPVVGDWDGDGIDEVGLHRETSGFFYWRNTLDTGNASGEIFFGDPGDRFVAGDWGTVDGIEAPAVFRPSNMTFYFRHTLTQGTADSQFGFGESGWLPVAGQFGLG